MPDKVIPGLPADIHIDSGQDVLALYITVISLVEPLYLHRDESNLNNLKRLHESPYFS